MLLILYLLIHNDSSLLLLLYFALIFVCLLLIEYNFVFGLFSLQNLKFVIFLLSDAVFRQFLAGIDRAVTVEYVSRGADNKEIWHIIIAKNLAADENSCQ